MEDVEIMILAANSLAKSEWLLVSPAGSTKGKHGYYVIIS
jgi:hypothetical protein